MSVAETDWQSFLSPGSILPPDVLFLVKDAEGEGGQSKTIAAHRFLLAGVSPVFGGMFFGPLRETGEVVEVKETTFEAFESIYNIIYINVQTLNITSTSILLFTAPNINIY